jgi:Family of unknown function (DUF6789)
MADDRDSGQQEVEEVESGESEVLHDLKKGIYAGLIATIPVAILAAGKQVLGLIPELDLITLMTSMTGIPWNGTGWVLLFVIGAILGMGFASLDSHVSDATTLGEAMRGALFGFLLWVILMIILIPLYDNDGFGFPFAGGVLAACLVFGVVMGVVYERMKPEHVT